MNFRVSAQAMILAVCLAAGAPAWGHAAADDEHASGAAAHGAAENPIDLKADLGLWTLVVFVVLAFVLTKFAWRPLAESLDARERHVKSAVTDAENARDQAKALLAQHERKMAEVQNEVRAILDEARRDAQHTQQEILKQTQEEAQAMRERAKREIEQARDQALQDLFHRSADLATEMASRIVRRSLSPQDHQEIVQQVLSELPSKN